MSCVFSIADRHGGRDLRIGVKSPGERGRVSPRVASAAELAAIAAEAGVGVDVVERIARVVLPEYGDRAERAGQAMLEQRIERVCDPGLRRRMAWRGRPLERSIDDWVSVKGTRGRTPKHRAECATILRRAAEACKWGRLADLSPESAERHLRKLLKSGASMRTVAKTRGALVNFGRWAERDGRLTANPFAGVEGVTVGQASRRLERRALTDQEVGLLLGWLDSGEAPRRGRMSAPTRAAAYALAIDLGLRRGELRALTWGDFDLAARTVRLRAETTKSGREAVLPLRREVVERLKGEEKGSRHRGIKASRGAFGLPLDSARVLREDLAGARAWWVRGGASEEERSKREASDVLSTPDRAGRVVDFHALRATAATRLARAGVDPALTKQLLRHSSYSTTAGYYVRAGVVDLAAALEKVGGVAHG